MDNRQGEKECKFFDALFIKKDISLPREGQISLYGY